MKKIKLFTLLLFSISAFSQGWLPVGNPYVTSTFPWGLQTSSDADFKLNSVNVPYVFYQTDFLSAGIVKKFENGAWTTVGNTNFAVACNSPSISISNNATYIAYQNEDFKAEVRRLNGPNWELMGAAGFSPDLANYITIRVNSNDQPFVAYADGSQFGRITVKKFNFLTSQWESVGSEGFSTLRATHVNFEIATNNDLYVSYLDGDENSQEILKVCVKKFDGTNWISVGPDRFTANNALFNSFALDNNNIPYVIYSDLINDMTPKLNVQKFNGTSWEYVGLPRFSSRESQECDIDFDANNKPNIVYIEPPHFSELGEEINASISSMIFENGSWQFKGIENFNNWSNSIKPCIEIGTNNIAYISDDKSYFDTNSNLQKEGYIAYFGTATSLINPTLTGVSQFGVQCSDQNQSIELSGMQPNSTSSIEYNINGVVQPDYTNVTSYSNGYATMYITIPASSSGQTLTITKVTRTDIAGTTPLVGMFSTTIQSNELLTYYQDNDGDGLGNSSQTYESCDGQPLNFVTNNTDCDDSNPDPFVNTFSNPTPSVCIAGSPTLVTITDNSRPVSGTNGGCLNANYGQYPEDDYTPSNYDGVTPNIILTNGYAGEYSVVNIVPNTKYIFKSDRFYNSSYGANSQNDRVTIGSIDGTTILASGQHTAVWQSSVATQVRFYSHANYDFTNQNNIGPCGTESFSRTRSVICAPITLVKPVVWSPVFGLFTDAAGTIPYTGQLTTQVYAKPNQNTTYSLTNSNGCIQANAITVVISNVGTTYYQDADNDGFGNNSISQQSCTQPIGYVSNNIDCDDTNTSITTPTNNYTTISSCDNYTWSNSGLTYTSSGEYTGTTTNCVTEKLVLTIIPNSSNSTTITACETYIWENNNQTYTQSGTYVGTTSNCVTEILNLTITPLLLNDTTISACDTYTWFDGTEYTQSGDYFLLGDDCSISRLFLTINQSSVYYADNDNDGYGDANLNILSCEQIAGYVINDLDCNDTNPNINPNQVEIPNNGIDDNCDGILNENYIAIPDANFEQALFDLGIDAINGDHQVLESAVNSLTSLSVSNYNISNLTGIQHFTSLISLSCDSNVLTALDVSSLSNLELLDCSNNLINSLNLAGATSLFTISCHHNQLTNLDLSGLTNLFQIVCYNNLIANINLNGATSLSSLFCYNNQLTSLNLSGLSNLYRLDCYNNSITSINFTGATSLQELYCQNNELTSLDLTGLSINHLSCESNLLSSLNLSNLIYNQETYDSGYVLHCENNPFLTCITVPDTSIANSNPYLFKDEMASYSTNCSNPTFSSILSGNSTICSGDSTNINVAITGGTSPYTVVINDGFTNNTITNYVSGTNISVIPITNTTYTLVSVMDANNLIGTENSGIAFVTIGTPILYYLDLDGDGFGNNANTFFTCTEATGYVTNNLDCDDTNLLINPDAAEIAYDGIDNDCDGVLDNGFQLLTTEVTSPTCGSTLATPSSLVGVRNFSLSKNVTSYRFKATGPSGDLTVVKTTPHFQFSELVGWQYGTTYTVSCELQVGGVWAGYYGPTCTISTPNVIAAGLSQIVSPACNTVVTSNTVIATTSLSGVTGYRFQVTNTTPGYAGSNAVQTIDRTVQWFKLNLLAEYVYGSTYTVEVAVKTSGTYGAFGPVCTFTTTRPVVAQCGTTVTAGSLISSTSMGGVTQYTYQVTNLSNSNVQTIVRTSPNFSTNLITGYSSTTSYSISVAVTSTGVQSPYTESCIINSAPAVRYGNTTITNEFKVQGFPNPFTNNFIIDITRASEEKVSVVVYDMIGKLLDRVEVNATDNTLELGANYPAGVYNVIASQGEKVETVRMVKR